jgi:peptidase S41-like protein
MSRRLACAVALFAALCSTFIAAPTLRAQTVGTQQSTVAIPDTPAGRVLKVWLDAFNSGDSARISAYCRTYQPQLLVANQIAFRAQTGGFDLLSIEASQPGHIEYTVRERNSATTAFGSMDLVGGEPLKVASSSILALPPGSSAASFKIDAAERGRVIDGAIAQLDEYYVFPEVAKKMADTLRARMRRSEYDAVTNGMSFANVLTRDLQDVSHDKHLRVNFNPGRFPDPSSGPPPDAAERYRRQMDALNCGFIRAEQLQGNVGYLKFNMFADPDVCGPTASAAMNFLAGTDALILDLRDNGGGDPAMVAFLCSYLFDEATHLNDLWTRKTGATHQYWTLPFVPGRRFGGKKPIYVLTSNRTFSGGEEFTYDLKNLKRATIVGETTGGGAHPVSGHPIDEHFMIGVPFARAINPVSGTNWEGAGVEPDIKVPAADALATAQKLVAEKLSAKKA